MASLMEYETRVGGIPLGRAARLIHLNQAAGASVITTDPELWNMRRAASTSSLIEFG